MLKKKIFIILTSVAFLTLAGFVFAQPPVCDPAQGLCNPLGDRDVTQILDDVVDFLLAVAVPIAVIATVWAGFLFMTAGGSEDKIRLAKRAITYTVIGIAILIISKGITSVLLSFF
jgi:hypothetical protein